MATASPSPFRVLVAEDAEDVAAWLGILLRNAGYDVRAATTGAETVALAAAFRPQAIILDIGLPDMDGYEAARRIKALPGGDAVVFIAATGWGEPEDLERARAAGFQHHLVKPAPPEKLLKLLAEISNHP